MVARHVGPLGRASHWLVSLQCLLSFALIAVLNTWWFVKMAQGLSRLWSRGGATGKKESGGGPASTQRQRRGKEEVKGEGGDESMATRAGASTKTTSSSKGRTRRQGKAA